MNKHMDGPRANLPKLPTYPESFIPVIHVRVAPTTFDVKLFLFCVTLQESETLSIKVSVFVIFTINAYKSGQECIKKLIFFIPALLHQNGHHHLILCI